MTVTEDLVLRAAIRTDVVGKVFNDPDNRNVHQLRHFDGFFDDHGYQFLR